MCFLLTVVHKIVGFFRKLSSKLKKVKHENLRHAYQILFVYLK